MCGFINGEAHVRSATRPCARRTCGTSRTAIRSGSSRGARRPSCCAISSSIAPPSTASSPRAATRRPAPAARPRRTRSSSRSRTRTGPWRLLPASAAAPAWPCPNAAAALFTGAKIAHLGHLPQGQPERLARAISMTNQARAEGFGHCTTIGECEAVCPAGIKLEVISRMNRDVIKATMADAQPRFSRSQRSRLPGDALLRVGAPRRSRSHCREAPAHRRLPRPARAASRGTRGAVALERGARRTRSACAAVPHGDAWPSGRFASRTGCASRNARRTTAPREPARVPARPPGRREAWPAVEPAGVSEVRAVAPRDRGTRPRDPGDPPPRRRPRTARRRARAHRGGRARPRRRRRGRTARPPGDRTSGRGRW